MRHSQGQRQLTIGFLAAVATYCQYGLVQLYAIHSFQAQSDGLE